MISCRNLTRRYGDFTAVDHLDLEVAEGAICAFLGPNGAGKSTTVKMLTGLLAPTEGEVEVCGLNVAADPIAVKRRDRRAARRPGALRRPHRGGAPAPHRRCLRVGQAAKPARRAGQLLHALSLEHGRHTFAAACSHGMRKKTSFAMALLPNPRVLFLDEPFEAIDPVTSKIMRDLLQSVARRGVTVFLTSHILAVAEEIATQIVMLRKGKKVWDSPAEEVPQSLEQHYFDLVEAPVVEEIEWLGHSRS